MTERHYMPNIASQHGLKHPPEDSMGPKKTALVLVIVVGCFAVLWPSVFHPMLIAKANNHIKPGPSDKGCCDVILESDIDTIKIMSELCSKIIDDSGGKTRLDTKEIVYRCRKAVLEKCGIDISAALQERVSLGHSVKQILEEVRSLNGSLCLKYNFGVSPWRLGVPHRITVNLDPFANIRQERPTHPKPEMMHPAFRERGRAIPQPDLIGKRPGLPPKTIDGRPGPIPGMRPTIGGPGRVVQAREQSWTPVLMPVYTIVFVMFFSYFVLKIIFKKKSPACFSTPLYPPVDTDDEFRKEVFDSSRQYFARPNQIESKIVVHAVAALLEEVNQELEARKRATLDTEQDEIKANGSLPKEDAQPNEEIATSKKEEEEQGSVTVMGMETTASCEGGKKWSRPDSPVLPHPAPVAPKEPSPPPQQIFLEGSLPPQSQILVADSATETQKAPEDDSPVVLAGKMTLSVISLDSDTGTEDSSTSGKRSNSLEGSSRTSSEHARKKEEVDRRSSEHARKNEEDDRRSSEDDRRTSSSNVSEEFEKINAAELEEQINNIIEEAEDIVSEAEEKRYSPTEDLQKLTENQAQITPRIDEKSAHRDVLEEIKNQLNLDDNLLEALEMQDAESKKILPVSDLIKEFLNNEEHALIADTFGGDVTGVKKEEEVDKDVTDSERKEARDDIGNKELISKNSEKEDTLLKLDEVERVEEQEKPKENTVFLSDEASSTVEEAKYQTGAHDSKEDTPNLKENKTDIEECNTNQDDSFELSKSIEQITREIENLVQSDDNDTEHLQANESEENECEMENMEYNEDESESEDSGRNWEEDVELESGRDLIRDVNVARDSRNGTVVENEISDEEELENEDDEEIEEIIEYVDDTDEEGEEIIEVNGNEDLLNHQNGAH